MTNNHYYWLGGLLILQLLIAAGLLWRSEGHSTARQEPFLNFDPDKIDGIKISDRNNTVTLAKKDGHWLIPEFKQLPASEDKAETILSKLKKFTPVWPVATTAASHERFEVADDKFQRKVRFYQGETLAAEWYLGTSPGFRKSHIRKAGDDAVYTIVLSGFELPVKNGDWLDKGLLGAAEITGIKGPDYTLEKADNTWRFAKNGATEGEAAPELDQDKARQLVSALTGLQVLGVAEKAPNNAVKTIEVKTPNGSWTYNFMQADDKCFVSRNDRDTVFSLSQFDFDRIAEVDLAKLLKEKTETEPAKADTPERGKTEPAPK
jgi:hypothetical protein